MIRSFRATKDGPFVDNNQDMASPPWTSLHELEQVSLKLERDDARGDPSYAKWLRMLIAPGGSLGISRDEQERIAPAFAHADTVI